jgi:hypothetical protein
MRKHMQRSTTPPKNTNLLVRCVLSLQVGAFLQDVAPAGLHSVFERFRAILHEGAIDRRCQYMIEGLFAIRKVRLSATLCCLSCACIECSST